MQTIDAFIKAKDAAGHEHGEDGKFVATGTKRTNFPDGGFVDHKVSAEYKFKPREDGGLDVHAPNGDKVGHSTASWDRDRWKYEGTYTGGKKSKGVSTEWARPAAAQEREKHETHARAVANEHFKGVLREHAKTVKGSGMQTADDVLSSMPMLRKMEDVVVATGNGRVQGSMEHFIDTVRDPLVAGCGCPYAPKLDETGAAKHNYDDSGPHHWPSVEATFADRGIVHCYECGKYWEVPFTIEADGDKSSVVTGDPQERAQAFISPDAIENADDDGDEPEETT